MTTVIPSSISNVSLVPGTAFTTRKSDNSTSFSFSSKSRFTLYFQRYLLPLSTSVKPFPQCSTGYFSHHASRIPVALATGTDVAVEEPDSPVAEVNSSEDTELQSDKVVTSEKPPVKSDSQSKRTRLARKSEMPPIKNEELVTGATFMGKVRSIQPFGAFVDFGAFTDGLVHVSRLSDSYVKDVASVVSVGQEVKVRVVEANTESGRISLTMRDSDDVSKLQQRKEAPVNNDKSGSARKSVPKPRAKKDDFKKNSKFVKGQDVQGTVKNLTRAGAFIALPEGEEGFLPRSEEVEEGFGNIMGGTSLEAGQEVNIRVLRITKGQVTLTMKKDEDLGKLDAQLNQGVVHNATNPFVLAFRQNKDIATFLDEREKVEKAVKQPIVQRISEIVDNQTQTTSELPEVAEDPISVNGVETNEKEEEETHNEIKSLEESGDEGKTDLPSEDGPVTDAEASAEKADEGALNEALTDELPPDNVPESVVSISEELVDVVTETEDKSDTTDEVAQESEPIPDKNGSITSSDEVKSDGSSDPSEDLAEDQINNSKDDGPKEAPETKSEAQSAELVKDDVSAPNENENEIEPKAVISPALVKQLREETGAGMMDCKKALAESGGDIVKAQEFLRKKGLASAEKKASRATAEGRIGSYVHDNRIGVLVEVNCETDFVSRGDIFKELVEDLAMQVAACPQVQYVVAEDVPGDIIGKEREIEMQKEDLLSKPEQIRSKIVEGRIRKRLEELALLEQPYIKNDKVVVKDWVKQTIATIGENIKVKRFVRFNLGEGLEKKSQDFAAEVAAQTAARPVSSPGKEQPAVVDAAETADKPPAVAVSAALVKQLREETGAGMMDCKKALSETDGDLEKAQEYLRKKGLSAADKKSSRLAAEGRIGSYIHDSRIGVLIEVNCETDFVGRSENFRELVEDLAMQVVACPQVQYVSIEDIPESIVSKERELEMQREDLQSKPENIRERIVDGRISKRLGELALLEQPFIKNDSVLVKDLVKQTVAALGENIKVRRFVRFTLGETTDDANPETEEA